MTRRGEVAGGRDGPHACDKLTAPDRPDAAGGSTQHRSTHHRPRPARSVPRASFLLPLVPGDEPVVVDPQQAAVVEPLVVRVLDRGELDERHLVT